MRSPARIHGCLLRLMLDHVNALAAQVEAQTERIDAATAPFARHVAQLDEIPGIGVAAAQDLLAESGSPGALPHRGPSEPCGPVVQAHGSSKPRGRCCGLGC